MSADRGNMTEGPPSAPAGAPNRARLRPRLPGDPGLATRLFAIFLIASLPAVALAFWTAEVDRKRRTDEMRQQTVRLAGLIASEHRRIMDTGRGILVAVAHLPQVTERHGATCGSVLAQIVGYYQVYANIGIASLEGDVLCSAKPARPNVNLSDRAYFDEVLRTRDFVVSEYQISRITNRPSISFAYPVMDDTGEPTAVVIAALDLNLLALAAEQMLTQLPQGSTFTMLDANGTVIAHKPGGPEHLGAPLPNADLLSDVLATVPGTRRIETENGHILHAYAPVRNPLREEEWFALLSIPESTLMSSLSRSFQQSLLTLALVVVIAATLSRLAAEYLVLRPATRILDATRHMQSGNLGVRIGPDYGAGELGELARSFDSMAAALDQRERLLEDQQERLASMSRRLLLAQEEERRRIARELHDELGQLLTGAKLNLVSLQGGSASARSITGAAPHPPAMPRGPHPAFDPLDDTIDLVARAITTVRELSTELRPAILDDAGLEEALHWLLERTGNRAGFAGHLEAEPLGPDISTEVETTLFRFAQEALTNVTRHAAASRVNMTLRRRGSYVELVVQDDGAGFDAVAARRRAQEGKSLGIIGMEERITLSGGRLEIDSAPGRGARLRAVVPLRGAPGADDVWDEEEAC